MNRSGWIWRTVMLLALMVAGGMKLSASPGDVLLTIENPNPPKDISDNEPEFGRSIAIVGNNLLVGAPYYAQRAGACFLFDSTTAELLLTIPNPDPATKGFGISVAALGENLIIGNGSEYTTKNYAYLFDGTLRGTASVPLLTIPAPVENPNRWFGFSVAALGEDILVGAPAYYYNTGAVYLFDGTVRGTAKPPIMVMTAPYEEEPPSPRAFGNSLAVVNGNILVGACYPFGDGSMYGKAYLFDGSVRGPTETSLLTIMSPQHGGRGFGASVAAMGNNLLVSQLHYSARVFLFDGSLRGTTSTPLLTTPPDWDVSGFGHSVAAMGDKIVVGSNDDECSTGGYAFLFGGTLTGTTNPPSLTLRDPALDWESCYYFGESVATSGNRIFVGAREGTRPSPSGGDARIGAVYAFDGTMSGTSNLPEVVFTIPTNGFGNSAAVLGNDLAVAAPLEYSGDPRIGAVYIYDGASGAMRLKLVNPVPIRDDWFGDSLAAEGGYVVVGTFTGQVEPEDPPARAYLFDGTLQGTSSTPLLTIMIPGDSPLEFTLVIHGDKILVTMAFASVGGVTNSGISYLFDATLRGTTSTPLLTFMNPAPLEKKYFGGYSFLGEDVILGARDISGEINAGSLYLFDGTLQGTTSTPLLTINAAYYAVVGFMGNILVGSRYDDTGAVNAGAAYLYDGSLRGTASEPLLTILNPSPAENDYFGHQARPYGNNILVSANGDDTDGPDAGSLYFFDGSLRGTTSTPIARIGSVRSAGVIGSNLYRFNSPPGTYNGADSVEILCGIEGPCAATPTPTPTPFDDATLVAHTMPAEIPTDHGVPVEITMHNSGNTVWTWGESYSLAVIADDCTLAPFTRIGIDPAAAVQPGQDYTFTTLLTGPAATGSCPIEFRMVREFVAFFGETLSLAPAIIEAVNDAAYVSNTIPLNLTPGESVGVGITFENTGNTWWLPSKIAPGAARGGGKGSIGPASFSGIYALAVKNDPCGLFSETELGINPWDAVGPGKRIQFIAQITAPMALGLCELVLRMREGYAEDFGTTLSLTVNVAPPANRARDWENYE